MLIRPVGMIGAVVFSLALSTASAAQAVGDVEIHITGLRNGRGSIQLCMTSDPHHFPDCEHDPKAFTRTIRADAPIAYFRDVPVGSYAIAVFHDENNNRKLDTFLGIPREGFGFSRNPQISFGAPRFDKVNIGIGPGLSCQTLHLQYLL